VTRGRPRAILVAATLLGVACAGGARTPADVVGAYFRGVGRNPIATLPLTTDAFHERHGLQLAARSGAGADEARAAWLAVQSRPELLVMAQQLRTQVASATESGDTAVVLVQVATRAGIAFEQRFALVRDWDGAWRIDAIEQSGVEEDDAIPAFVAYPNEAARRALMPR
jgi:hypothetical protein